MVIDTAHSQKHVFQTEITIEKSVSKGLLGLSVKYYSQKAKTNQISIRGLQIGVYL